MHEGEKAEAGVGDALDDLGRFGRVGGIPVVGDGVGEAAELDDGEFAGELALEGVDAVADLGDGHGVTSDGGVFYIDGQDGQDFGEMPFISAYFGSFE